MQYNIPQTPSAFILKIDKFSNKDVDFQKCYENDNSTFKNIIDLTPYIQEFGESIVNMSNNRGSLASVSLLRNQIVASGTISNYTGGTNLL